MDDSDEALMARIARGDEPAFRTLASRHLPAMLGLARRILGNTADAEDVAQEAMLRVWTHAPRWQPLALFRTWLTRVVVNLCLDRKRRAPWVALDAAGEIVDPALVAGEKADRDERDRMVSAAITEWPARQRAAIMLTYGVHEQRAGGGHPRHVGIGGGDTPGAWQTESAPRAWQYG